MLLTFTIKFGGNGCYRKINARKSQALVAGSDSDADVKIYDSAPSLVHIYQFVCAVRVLEVQVLVCLHSSCNHVTEDRRFCDACIEDFHAK